MLTVQQTLRHCQQTAAAWGKTCSGQFPEFPVWSDEACVRGVWQVIWEQEFTADSRPDALRRTAICLQRLWQTVHPAGSSGATQSHSYWGKDAPMLTLWQGCMMICFIGIITISRYHDIDCHLPVATILWDRLCLRYRADATSTRHLIYSNGWQ